MNEVEMLALGYALARTSEVLCPGECLAFRDYLQRVLRNETQIAAVFGGDAAFLVSVDGRPVEGPGSTVPVRPAASSSIDGRDLPWTCSPAAWSGGSA